MTYGTSVPLDDRGLAYGDGVFRTLAVRDGEALHWPRHYRKLADDCRRLDLACPEEIEVKDALACVVPSEGRHAAKVIVTRGGGRRGYRPVAGEKARLLVTSAAMPPRPTEGVAIRWCRLRFGFQPALAGVKHLNRLENVLAQQEWLPEEAWEGLILDQDGWLVSGSMSNVFIWSGGELSSPLLDRCGVAGVTRQRILDAALALGLRIRLGRIGACEVLAAEELFLCNSLAGLVPVGSLGARRWYAWPMAMELRRQLDQGELP